jgi:uncharacterized protein (TIGR04255 family)
VSAPEGRRCVELSETSTDLWAELSNLVRSGQHYERAPIVEAILEVRVRPTEGQGVEELDSVVQDPDFPDVAQLVSVTSEIQMGPSAVVGQASGEHIGFAFRRKDGQRVVQAQLDKFSFSWLAPYENWEAFVDEAMGHWDRYCQVAKPGVATRLGIRFVNKIDIDRASVEIKDYLRTTVDISPYLPQALLGYFMQVDIPLPRHEAVARVVSTLVSPKDPEGTSLILDIDTWRDVTLDLTTGDVRDSLLGYLDVLRSAKNYVFEACITDATRGVIS